MSLYYSPVAGKELATLGIEKGEFEARLVRKANAAIYFSCMATLMFGRRDLLPVVWAWSQASNESNLITNFAIASKENAVKFLTFFIRNLTQNKIDYRISADPNSGVVNCVEIAFKLLEYIDLNGVVEKGSVLTQAMKGAGFDSDSFQAMSVISKLAFLGLMISEGGYYYGIDTEEANSIVDISYTELSSVAGIDFTRFPELAHKGFTALKDAYNMYSVWSAMSDQACCIGAVKTLKDSTLKESAEEKMSRRWKSGVICASLKSQRDYANSSTVEEVLVKVGTSLKNEGAPLLFISEALDAVVNSLSLISSSLDNYVPITFMDSASFSKFKADKLTKTIWDLEKEVNEMKTWHSKYSDIPIDCRKIVERRLWGEKCKEVVYAALISPALKDVVGILARNYGMVAIEWDKKVFDYSTLTINDSMTAPYSLPATKDNRVKFLLPWIISRMQGASPNKRGIAPYIQECVFGFGQWINYIEVQIHSRLTIKDVESVRLIKL